MLNAECRIQNAECGMRNAECGMLNAECKIHSPLPLSSRSPLSLSPLPLPPPLYTMNDKL